MALFQRQVRARPRAPAGLSPPELPDIARPDQVAALQSLARHHPAILGLTGAISGLDCHVAANASARLTSYSNRPCDGLRTTYNSAPQLTQPQEPTGICRISKSALRRAHRGSRATFDPSRAHG